MINSKIVKKNITSAMKELEVAILNKEKKSLVKKHKGNLKNSNKAVKNKENTDVLLLTDVFKKSPFYTRDLNKVILKNKIQSIIESDIKLWVKANMHIVTDDYVRRALKTINFNS
jgi:hypothetical protein